MGAAGAAIGTVMAGIVNLLVLVGFILYKKIPYVLEVSKHFGGHGWRLRNIWKNVFRSSAMRC